MYTMVQTAVARDLIDPDSARFRDPYAAKTTLTKADVTKNVTVVCGEVNAKNRMGGYVGFEPYAVIIENGKVAKKQIGAGVEFDCQRIGYNPG